MSLRTFFNTNKLRQTFLNTEDSLNRRHCLSSARLVAAFYLGLPLFSPDNNQEGYPTLFKWIQYTDKDVTGKAVNRESAAQEIPEEFSPRLPVALLLHLGQDLEAILYSDHFGDRRSSLLLRILVDSTLGLNLTDEFVADFLLTVVEKQCKDTAFLCEQLLPSVLELDVVLAKNYLQCLEMHIMDRIETLFAQLPLKSTETKTLPRSPIYMISTSSVPSQAETSIRDSIHSLLRVVLTSLHLTNRLSLDLKRTMSIFVEPEAQLSGGKTMVTRLAVVVLSLIYRDSFSLAEEEKWSSLPEIAMKYKSLIEGESHQDAVRRWHSMADQQDIDHINLFFEFVKSTYQSTVSLPPLDGTTRELWHGQICLTDENFYSGRESTDWVSGLILPSRTVPFAVWEQMKFVSTRWKGFTFPDSSLIPLRLYVSPDILCKQQIATPKYAQTAREQLESSQSAREDRVFVSRSQILHEYTLRAKEELAKRMLKEKRPAQTQREPRFMRSTMTNLNIRKIAETQHELRKSLESEKLFLNSPSKTVNRHSLNSSPCSSSSSSLSSTSHNLREDVIRKDIKKLNEKIEVIGKLLVEERKRNADMRQAEAISTERSDSVATSLPPLPDNYNQVPAMDAAPPPIEKLDLTMLSPSPRPRPRSPDSEDEEEGDDDEVKSQLSTLSMSTANTLQEDPMPSNRSLIRPQSERLPLLHYQRKEGFIFNSPIVAKIQPQIATSERAIQTVSPMTLVGMKPMTRMDISQLYSAGQIAMTQGKGRFE